MKIINKTPSKDFVEDIPNPLYKYYRFDDNYDAQRLSGELYFSSPHDFNDPYDCQREICNNTPDLIAKNPTQYNDEWLEDKLKELGFARGDELQRLKEGLKCRNGEIEKRVSNQQVLKLGILCLTTHWNKITMWAYYNDHKGYCIEYNTENIMRDVTIGFINNMESNLINLLLNKKNYKCDIAKRCPEFPLKQIRAKELFPNFESLIKLNLNVFNGYDKLEVLNFVRNVYIKRCWTSKVDYKKEIDTKPCLFFDKTSEEVPNKYTYKLDCWKEEDEFRIGLSLGGKNTIHVGKDRVKSIYFGIKADDENIKKALKLFKGSHKEVYKIIKESYGFDKLAY